MFNIMPTKYGFFCLNFGFGGDCNLATPLPPHPWVYPCMRHWCECWKARGMVTVYIILSPHGTSVMLVQLGHLPEILKLFHCNIFQLPKLPETIGFKSVCTLDFFFDEFC
jgi:hypothetical protein